MAITITLLILAALLGLSYHNVSFWRNYEKVKELEGRANSSDFARRKWHSWVGISAFFVLTSIITAFFYDMPFDFWGVMNRLADLVMYWFAAWVTFTVLLNRAYNEKWNHVGTGNKTDDTIGKVAKWLNLKPTTLNGIIIVLLGLAAISRVVFVWKMQAG